MDVIVSTTNSKHEIKTNHYKNQDWEEMVYKGLTHPFRFVYDTHKINNNLSS